MHAHHHRVTHIAKQGELAIPVNSCTEWGTVHEYSMSLHLSIKGTSPRRFWILCDRAREWWECIWMIADGEILRETPE